MRVGHSARTHLSNHLDPEIERQILAFWIAEIGAKLGDVSLAQDLYVEAGRPHKTQHIVAIAL